ncbi:hypothetical protein TNCV_2287781 [Trichonephila clavipes]|nr:hypothetical protein TNCV_2287781 [Trichonephila clavipes]
MEVARKISRDFELRLSVEVDILDNSIKFYNLSHITCGPGSLVVTVMSSWLACQVLDSCATEDPPCRGGRCPPVGAVVCRGQLKCLLRCSMEVQNYEVRR